MFWGFIYKGEKFKAWADDWLSGEDRNMSAAAAAAAAARSKVFTYAEINSEFKRIADSLQTLHKNSVA